MDYLTPHIESTEIEVENRLLDGKVVLVVIPQEGAQEFINEHSLELAKCYIDPTHLADLANMNGLGVGEQLDQLLPDQNHLRSGDFGEILTRAILQQRAEHPRFPAYRWRNRSTKNDTVRGTDLIGYLKETAEDSKNDVLILCEVKTRARTVKPDIVNDAYEGVVKDYASRLATSIFFNQKRLLEDGLPEEAAALARFTNPHRTPYKKQLVAAVVHDAEKWNDQYLDVLPEQHGLSAGFEVLIVKAEDLAGWIDEVYQVATDVVEE